jgi:TRIC channel
MGSVHITMQCISTFRRHPLSCWLSSMVVCFAGSFLANFLLGEPMVATFKRHEDIVLATVVWYLIFYSPFDIVSLFALVSCPSKRISRFAGVQGLQATASQNNSVNHEGNAKSSQNPPRLAPFEVVCGHSLHYSFRVGICLVGEV